MAKVHKNLFMQGLSGKLGDQLVFRHLKDGRTIVCVKPDFSKRVLSKDQKRHHERFKAAAAYARAAARKNSIYAELAAGTMKTAYNVALSDWFHPPVIHHVERRGAVIRIQASDNVYVAGVQVTILDEQGKVVEKGEGIRGDSGWWEYMPAGTGKIVVEARDLAGNVTRKERGE